MTIISTGECVTSSAVCGLSVNIFLIENGEYLLLLA